MKKIIALLLCLLLIAGCNIKKEPQAIEMTLAETLEKFNNNDSFAFIVFYEGCLWCAEAKPVFFEIAKEEDIDVYYMNFSHIWENEQNEDYDLYCQNYDILMKYLDSLLVEDDDGERGLWVPEAVFVKNGVVVDGHCGTVDTHDPYESLMTEDEANQLRDYYRKGFERMR